MLYQYRHNSPHVVLRAPFDELSGSGFAPNRSSLGSEPQASLGTKRQFVVVASKAKAAKALSRKKKTAKKKKKTQAQLAERRKLELREQYADQREASRIMWAKSTDGKPKGVTLCDWTLQHMAESVTLVRETVKGQMPKAFYRGLAKCKLGWVCPICTKAKSEEAREKVNAMLSKGRRKGWRMVMMTLTARHSIDMPFASTWEAISEASKELRRTDPWKALNKEMLGSASAIEVTYGANGWHPHYHVIIVLPDSYTDETAAEAVETLRRQWLRLLKKHGLSGNQHAFDVQGAAAAGNYLTKWGAAEELTLGHVKQGREGQRTPWQLLRDSRNGDWLAGELWYEFTVAIKGAHRIRLTPGLNQHIKDELVHLAMEKEQAIADGKLDPEPEAKEVVMANMQNPEWMDTGRHRRVMMREGAEAKTRKQAEKDVWAARHGDETDADLLRFDVIDDGDDDSDAPQPIAEHDEPEKHMQRHARKRSIDRKKLKKLDQELDETGFLDRLEKPPERCG